MSKHRRWIVVPRSTEATVRLDEDAATPEDLVEWELTEQEFRALWRTGVFAKLNEGASAEIDDYEDACLRGEQLQLAASAISAVSSATEDASVAAILGRLSNLVQIAENLGTEIHFFL